MSHRPSWHTKEDILHDLVVMGQMTNIDEGYLVTGEKPPPPRHEFEDDEIDLRFGGIADDGHTHEVVQPDLMGITQFLRMVNDDDSHPTELPDDEITITKPGISTCLNVVPGDEIKTSKTDSRSTLESIPDDTIKIISQPDGKSNPDTKGFNGIETVNLGFKSKLDPTVAEFIPKSANDRIVSNNISDTEKTNETNGGNVVSKEINSTFINLTGKVDTDALNRKEKDDITAKLRDKICDTLTAETPQLKKEKNVAIANLMRLHTTKSRTSTSTNESHIDADSAIKLLTPDYYKRCAKFSPSSSNTQRSTGNKNMKKTRLDESNNSTPEPVLNSSSSASPIQANIISLNSSMEESIKKVNRWLEQPESPKPNSPAVCLGPISFKKKDQNHANSPTNDPEQKRAQSTAVYRPSQYANDLGKKYIERSKVKELQSLDIWSRLEKELKARDKIIKKKQMAERQE